MGNSIAGNELKSTPLNRSKKVLGICGRSSVVKIEGLFLISDKSVASGVGRDDFLSSYNFAALDGIGLCKGGVEKGP